MAHNEMSGVIYAEALLLNGDALMANCAMDLYKQSLEVTLQITVLKLGLQFV
jgi:hypothetical protein